MIKWKRIPAPQARFCFCGHGLCAKMAQWFRMDGGKKVYRCFKHMKAYDKMAPLHRPDAGSETKETLQTSTAALSSEVLQR